MKSNRKFFDKYNNIPSIDGDDAGSEDDLEKGLTIHTSASLDEANDGLIEPNFAAGKEGNMSYT